MFHDLESFSLKWEDNTPNLLTISWGPAAAQSVVLPKGNDVVFEVQVAADNTVTFTFSSTFDLLSLIFNGIDANPIFSLVPSEAGWSQSGNCFMYEHSSIVFSSDGLVIVGTIDISDIGPNP